MHSGTTSLNTLSYWLERPTLRRIVGIASIAKMGSIAWGFAPAGDLNMWITDVRLGREEGVQLIRGGKYFEKTQRRAEATQGGGDLVGAMHSVLAAGSSRQATRLLGLPPGPRVVAGTAEGSEEAGFSLTDRLISDVPHLSPTGSVSLKYLHAPTRTPGTRRHPPRRGPCSPPGRAIPRRARPQGRPPPPRQIGLQPA